MRFEKPREIAAHLLARRDAGGAFVEELLDTELSRARLAPADRGLCHELVCGVVRWQAALDWLIARKTDGRPQKPALQNLLRLGLYQLFWLDRIPAHAAVHETVEQAKHAGFGPQAGFLNALLRGYDRERDATKKLLAELKISQPALGYSHPAWLVERWQKAFGAENTARLLEWNNTPPKTFARVNALKFGSASNDSGNAGRAGSPLPAAGGASVPASRLVGSLAPPGEGGARGVTRPTMKDAGDLLARWRAENVDYDFVRRDWLEENFAFELKSHPPLGALPSFRDGWFYVQDPSTLLAVAELDPQPGETILDLCAAPGGKTTFIAQRMNNTGRILATDTSAERLKLVQENCARLGVTNVECGELSTFNPQPSTFDRVLVDAPCSNTGVLRRRVDLRWRIRPEEIARLAATQLELLHHAATLLRPGGTLLYSTCSLEPEENSEAVRQFLAGHAGFRLEHERCLAPFSDQVDGAYVANLVRGRQ